jgi:hypothetical protein
MTHVAEAEFLAQQRPSRIRAVQAGQLAWTAVDLVAIDDGDQPGALRSVIEQHGIQTRTFFIGQARHLVLVLSGEEGVLAPYVVLSCHGDDGIVLPQLADEIESWQPVHGRMRPQDVREHVRLQGQTVICTGCDTGNEEMADAFLDAGAGAYLAPTGAPFGYASVMAPALLFYVLTQGGSLDEAVATVNAVDAELAMWKLFRRGGI